MNKGQSLLIQPISSDEKGMIKQINEKYFDISINFTNIFQVKYLSGLPILHPKVDLTDK